MQLCGLAPDKRLLVLGLQRYKLFPKFQNFLENIFNFIEGILVFPCEIRFKGRTETHSFKGLALFP